MFASADVAGNVKLWNISAHPLFEMGYAELCDASPSTRTIRREIKRENRREQERTGENRREEERCQERDQERGRERSGKRERRERDARARERDQRSGVSREITSNSLILNSTQLSFPLLVAPLREVQSVRLEVAASSRSWSSARNLSASSLHSIRVME